MTHHEHSYGIIPLKLLDQKWETLLVQHQAGHWSFPKGHAQEGELPYDTAKRELLEETGLRVTRVLSETPFREHYFFTREGDPTEKDVDYFLAEVEGTPALQIEEIANLRWVSLEEAEECMTFEEGKRMCRTIRKFLNPAR